MVYSRAYQYGIDIQRRNSMICKRPTGYIQLPGKV
jgi:hypothetical protein